MLDHSQGAEKMKNKMPGIRTKRPVAMFTGLSRVFCKRPPQKNLVFPVKYS
jgi:hypothetical protein